MTRIDDAVITAFLAATSGYVQFPREWLDGWMDGKTLRTIGRITLHDAGTFAKFLRTLREDAKRFKHTHVYTSVFSIPHRDMNVIASAFWDLDCKQVGVSVEKFYYHVQSFALTLEQHTHVQPYVQFTGGGYHVILPIHPTRLPCKRRAQDFLKWLQRLSFLPRKHRLRLQTSVLLAADRHVFGDVARMLRLPHTYNDKYKPPAYVTPLDYREPSLSLAVRAGESISGWDFLAARWTPHLPQRFLLSPPQRRKRVKGGELPRDKLPPCIQEMIARAEKGWELGHAERFVLAAALPEDEVMRIMMLMPDFDEHRTQYQIQHVKSRGYTPGCRYITEQGLCPLKREERERCEWRPNPTVKLRRKRYR